MTVNTAQTIQSNQKKRVSLRKELGLFIIFVILLITAGYPYKGQIYQFMVDNKLVPLPETFTELYFNNHLTLSDTEGLSKKKEFSFTIHNLENKKMIYPLEVYIDTAGFRQILDNTSVSVLNNGYKTISESFIMSSSSARREVVVNLKNKNQQIDFWLEPNLSPTSLPSAANKSSTTPNKK